MIKQIIKISAVLLSFSLCLMLVGCQSDGSRKQKPAFVSSEGTVGETSVENSKFSLTYNFETSAIKLIDKSEDTEYNATVSDDSDQNFTNQQITTSSLVVYYIKQLDNNYQALFSSDAENCKQTCKEIKNGIKVIYTFVKEKISVPVDYVLTDNGLSASVNLNKITEGQEFMVGKIVLLPMFSRVANKNENGYLFIPSGCGGIAYTKDGAPKTATMDVYGTDLCEVQSRLWTTEKVCMPVFGAKQDESAYMGIVENGAEMASISSSVNDGKLGFSYIYPSFKVRGFNKVIKDTSQSVESFIYNEDIADETLKVNYYLLNKDNADYNGMANIYKKYLNGKYGKKAKKDAPVLSLKFLGGVEERKFFFGVPYDSVYPLTTVNEAKEITKEIEKATGASSIVQLAGYGKSGLSNKEIAGGYRISSKLGTTEDVAKWQKESVVALDFDIVNFSKSSNGFSVGKNAARSTTDDKVEQNFYQVALLSPNKAIPGYYLLSRYKLESAADKLLKYVNKGSLNTLSLSTLGVNAYSDYGNREYFAKAGMGNEVQKILSKFKGKTIVSNGAFEYYSALSDYIMDAPPQTSKGKMIDEEIPFYQMVFGSRVGIYNTSVNLETNDTYAILKAAEGGMGLEYTVNKKYTTKLLNSSENTLYATYLSGVKDRIVSEVNNYKSYYDLIKNSTIKQHTILKNGLRKITYKNGITVYVNYTDAQLSDGDVTVKANSFITKEG